jgi:hypothetical protein
LKKGRKDLMEEIKGTANQKNPYQEAKELVDTTLQQEMINYPVLLNKIVGYGEGYLELIYNTAIQKYTGQEERDIIERHYNDALKMWKNTYNPTLEKLNKGIQKDKWFKNAHKGELKNRLINGQLDKLSEISEALSYEIDNTGREVQRKHIFQEISRIKQRVDDLERNNKGLEDYKKEVDLQYKKAIDMLYGVNSEKEGLAQDKRFKNIRGILSLNKRYTLKQLEDVGRDNLDLTDKLHLAAMYVRESGQFNVLTIAEKSPVKLLSPSQIRSLYDKCGSDNLNRELYNEHIDSNFKSFKSENVKVFKNHVINREKALKNEKGIYLSPPVKEDQVL